MRRFILIMMLIVGALLGIGFPWYVSNFTGEPLAKLVFYQRGGTWKPVKVQLEKKLFPVGLKVHLLIDAPSDRLSETGRFALKVRGPNGLSYRDILEFSINPVGDGDANGTVQDIWRFADTLQFVANEPYVFELETLGKNPLSVKLAELHLTATIGTYDTKILPVGATLMGVGGFGLLLSFLAGRGKSRKQKKPRARRFRWGRQDDREEK